ncbi:unnamed protein product [Phytomonas sp. Hart1]|nr:unnamed protein product [Phytomonas sp. Hart1]|eukprot:CCW68037.1 unnamed protein product [Phytomonas sp. isolate Hart1]
MVKLDVSLLRFMEDEDFRILTALEMSMRNHDVAPTALVERIAQLPHGGCRKRLKEMLKQKIIHHENTAYDGYAMKYAAYDLLALRTLSKRGTCTGVGHRIGCGKESDIILVRDENAAECVLKLQRLGRCSFRSVMRNRDYKGRGQTRHGESWFYLSRLASQKEFSFMKALYEEGFPVPCPIDQNRHALLMGLVPGTLLNNVLHLGDPAMVYRRCLDLMVKLGEAGLIHGDFNEFNLMITDDQHVVMIDFPQMVSINHPNAAELFDRDVQNLANFFLRRFKLNAQYFPCLEKDVVRKDNLDKRVLASGHFTKTDQEDLERMMKEAFARHEKEEDAASLDSSESEMSVSVADEEKGDYGKAFCERVQMAAEVSPSRDDIQRNKDLNGSAEAVNQEGSSSSISGEEFDRNSLDLAMNRNQLDRAYKSLGHHNGENFLTNGNINEHHIQEQVRKDLRRQDNRNFNRGLRRNIQKGRDKQKIRRQVKNAGGNGFFD